MAETPAAMGEPVSAEELIRATCQAGATTDSRDALFLAAPVRLAVSGCNAQRRTHGAASDRRAAVPEAG
jgi:hypothetical protein